MERPNPLAPRCHDSYLALPFMVAPMMDAVTRTDFPDLKLFCRGKVRDIYDLGDTLLFVATDRISAFDMVLPDPIPGKGEVLNQMSAFWFDMVRDIVPNHLISVDVEDFPKETRPYRQILEGRSMLVAKAQRIDVECVVRGYLAGSGWQEYVSIRKPKSKTVDLYGNALPADLVRSQKLPHPIFTPAIKASSGHDENISRKRLGELVDPGIASRLEELSLAIYKRCASYAEKRGIIIADTKFEFGIKNDELILIDELLSPDSSRFWSMDLYEPGKEQDSFDKQIVRNYLLSMGWDKAPPAPHLPEDVIRRASQRYREVFELLTR